MTHAQIDTAERCYAAIRAGKAKGAALADGELVRSGPLAWPAGWAHSVPGRLSAMMMTTLLSLAAVMALGR